jgi:hypothetical protein
VRLTQRMQRGPAASSGDGTTLWVALDGAGAVRQIDLVSGIPRASRDRPPRTREYQRGPVVIVDRKLQSAHQLPIAADATLAFARAAQLKPDTLSRRRVSDGASRGACPERGRRGQRTNGANRDRRCGRAR